jgi:hypothetical protein
MRLSLNHANVAVVAVAESRARVVPVWSGAVASAANYRFRVTI